MDLQELITLGRHIFVGAPSRLDVYKKVDGKRTAKDISVELARSVNSVRNDLNTIANVGLISEKSDSDDRPIKRGRFSIYEKIPLAKTVSIRHFESTGKRPDTGQPAKRPARPLRRGGGRRTLSVPSEQEILDICNEGEGPPYEFKGQGTDFRKITREIAAMLHTRQGGIVFYGIADDGTIEGSDISRQSFDQSLQNSLRTTIDPPPAVCVRKVTVVGNDLLAVVVPPWNRRDIYVFDGRVLIRRGTNVFAVKSSEIKKLHGGEYID